MQYRTGDSHFLVGLMKAKDDFFARDTFKVHNGEQVRFWKDAWLGDKPFTPSARFTRAYLEL